MTTNMPSPTQLRLIIEAEDFDGALRFYRDLLGMPEQIAFATEGEDRVAILHAGVATIELATPTHAERIDEVEGAPRLSGAPRIALEVEDAAFASDLAVKEGAKLIAPPVRTPFQTINARVLAPAGWQVTFFQELQTLEARAELEGFSTDGARAR